MREILLYGVIGEGDCSAKAVMQQLAQLKPNEPVTVGINSGGGSFFEGEASYNALRRHKGRVVVRNDGIMASAASYIAMAADEILMAPGSHIMIHTPMAFGGGNQDELRAVIEKLEVFERQMCRVYAQRSGQDEAKVRQWMKEETWFTAEQAIQAGFADRIEETIAMAAAIPGDLSRFGYRNIPVAVKAMNDPSISAEDLTKTKIEAAKPKPDPTAEQKAEIEAARARRARRWKRIALMNMMQKVG